MSQSKDRGWCAGIAVCGIVAWVGCRSTVRAHTARHLRTTLRRATCPMEGLLASALQGCAFSDFDLHSDRTCTHGVVASPHFRGVRCASCRTLGMGCARSYASRVHETTPSHGRRRHLNMNEACWMLFAWNSNSHCCPRKCEIHLPHADTSRTSSPSSTRPVLMHQHSAFHKPSDRAHAGHHYQDSINDVKNLS